jgi:hypothetical protein
MADRTFSNFKEASEYAKRIAVEHKVTVSLERKGSAFCVEIPVGIVIDEEIEVLEYDVEDCSKGYSYEDDYDYQETQKEISEEAWDYAESMARSEEEGWFHPEREGSWEDNISNEED